MKISTKTFLISGGSSGLGLSTTKLLLSLSANIAILDLSPPPSDLLEHKGVKFWKTDVTNVDQIEKAVEESAKWAKESGKPIGGVICSAGVATAAKIIDAHNNPHSLDLWNFAISVNLTGTFNLARLVIPHIISGSQPDEDGERGIIIMVSSSAAFEGQTGQLAYSATKGALSSMTLPMARDLGRHGIRVVTIAPGVFASSMTDKFPPKTRGSLERELVFPKRFGKAEEFAQTVKWAIECSYVNGETVRLSGAGRLPGKM
ncbi:hypothetical protein JAAARDRAFT_42314 [Jaapia argillacea MUCL 33604]|uniref:Ketoreductase domain-containing protein n=1 Tax=Jaapia argillacea MUCL 33604 TaxID=933084 RepID=A0A067P5E4_9AGAM|nr:hypothetical protein JAAARDRAFT_42314 [Jaapia argillacea MUCL 33604]